MQVSEQVINGYNASRFGTNKQLLCHAPFVNLNFEQNGNVRACCYNTTHILGTWPRQTIKEIWLGIKADELRQYIHQHNLGGGCIECGNMLVAGNYQGVRARYYDDFDKGDVLSRIKKIGGRIAGTITYPKVMEFELSNQCNLECVMCNGYFSSSIRKNRESLPPINSVYNDAFVDELDEFIPHLTDAKFLGGEPFMIDIYLKIWERILKIKPGIRIHITTNGTFLNNRVRDLLEGLNAGIIMSIDSVVPETYRKIRVNGNLDKVLENLEYFRQYTLRKRTFLSMAACPITYNWHELPGLLDFCIERNIVLYFNAVFSPAELSLKEQTEAYLEDVIATLEKAKLPAESGAATSARNLSIKAYADFISQLKGWLKEKKTRPVEAGVSYVDTIFEKEDVTDWSVEEIRLRLQDFANANGKGYINKETQLLNRLANLFLATPEGQFKNVINCYFDLYVSENMVEWKDADDKAGIIAGLIENHPLRSTILLHMSKAAPLMLAEQLYHMDTIQLEEQLKSNFPQ